MLSDVVNAGEAYSALCALLWAVAVVLFRKSGEHVAPVALNLFKDTVGLALFLVTLPIIGVPYLPAEHGSHDWLVLLASGAVGIGIADSLFFASLNRLGAGRSAIVDCLYSPLVILCSFIYLGEPVGYPLLIAVGLMVAAILVGAWQPETSAAAEDKRDVRLGIALGVGSMLFMAIGIVIAKPVLNHTNPWWSTSVRLVGGVALLGVQVGLSSKRRDLLRCFRPGRLWRVTLPSAVVGVYLAMLFWIMGMTYTHTTSASVLNQSSVIFVLILATIFLREPFTLRKAMAIVMGFAGAVLAVL